MTSAMYLLKSCHIYIYYDSYYSTLSYLCNSPSMVSDANLRYNYRILLVMSPFVTQLLYLPNDG